jgi:hypothetical protein
MEPLSPSSPHSPVKALVDKIYYAKIDGEGLPTHPSKKTFVFHPKCLNRVGDENDMPADIETKITDMSPTRIRANRDNAVHHFRQARHANSRYAAYKKVEEDKKMKMRSKSEGALATQKMKDAAKKLMALNAITNKGGGGGTSSFAAKIAKMKLESEAKGENLGQKMRITEASTGSAVVVGRR